MDTMHYPKGRKPGKETAPRSGRVSSPYMARHTSPVGGEEERYRNQTNDYGKRAQPTERVEGGIRVNPFRTIRSPVP